MTPPESTAPREGWYPDPRDDHALRWWDGARWTRYTSERKAAPSTVREPAVEAPSRVDRPAARAERPVREPAPRRAVAVASADSPRTARLLAVGGAAGLLASLFMTWFTLDLGTAGATITAPLASTAPQWMAGTAAVLAVLAIGVLVLALGSASESPWGDRLAGLVPARAAAVPLAAALVIVYRIIDPPLLPGSEASLNLQGTVAAGAWVGLLCAAAMTAGVHLLARALAIGVAVTATPGSGA